MQNLEQLAVNKPSLPTGGGTISGLKADLSSPGADGAATLTLSLPLSAGRGYAPAMRLRYHSYGGNGPFGIGWSLSLPEVRRRTRKGAPVWDDRDEFIGPDGEVLVPEYDSDGHLIRKNTNKLLDDTLTENYNVTAWRSRKESDFSRLELWQPASESGQPAFWVMYMPDGQVVLLGRNSLARISDVADDNHVAVWLAESSVSASGEQIYYHYRPEDDTGCSREENAHHSGTSQRYLTAVCYGNIQAGRKLPSLLRIPDFSDWLFFVTLDYGECGEFPSSPPVWLMPGSGDWSCRLDCFSTFEFGFDIRTRRLCRNIQIFHRVALLNGNGADTNDPELVSVLRCIYDESPSVTTLISIQHVAYEADGTMCTLPPVKLGWQKYNTQISQNKWQNRSDLKNMNNLQPWQMVDLNGEGISGILYQDGKGWWYRAPQRDTAAPNAVTWGEPTPLPVIPSLCQGGRLADLNGDGRLEWLVTTSSSKGYHARTPEHEWLNFTPVSAFPVDFFHPEAMMADIIGNAQADIILIGPRAVRLYAGNEYHWGKGQLIPQPYGSPLPLPGTDERILVAFGDVIGSGQQHLLRIQADGVTWWPNLGHGRFGHPIPLPGFSQPAHTFNPQQVYLADLDGSGTLDLIYSQSNKLDIYLNQSGNSFTEPLSISLPEGVRFDETSSLQVADIHGTGMASLLLTITHPVPRHWTWDLSVEKPWLLSSVNNNMGSDKQLFYRSSVQFWLDEKAKSAPEKTPVCYLPFAVHTLEKIIQLDEITGNRLTTLMKYNHGAWEGKEREFCGFGYVETQDACLLTSQGTATNIPAVEPLITRSWYATGLQAVDKQLPEEYWKGDINAFNGFIPRFTTGTAQNEQEYQPDDLVGYWLHRGLRGILLRQELFGGNKTENIVVPFTLSEYRPQVRLINSHGSYPVVFPFVAESRSYNYDQNENDPLCSQQVSLFVDEFGTATERVDILYPRRPRSADYVQPEWFPDTLSESGYDEQQTLLRLQRTRNHWHHLVDRTANIWLLGLIDGSRMDMFTHPASSAPQEGITLENLLSGSLLTQAADVTFQAQEQIWYLDPQGQPATGTPAFPPRVAFTESAVMEENLVEAMTGDITSELLIQAGYIQTPYLFASEGDGEKLWVRRNRFTCYSGAEHFWSPIIYQDSLLAGGMTVSWDPYYCVITSVIDAAGLTQQFVYDWRYLQPTKIIDENDNISQLEVDALGRPVAYRFYGTENGEEVGYSQQPLSLPDVTISSFSSPLPVAWCQKYAADSWMNEPRQPPHIIVFSTDRYDDDPDQKIRQQIILSDGFGRVLQTSIRQVSGMAYELASDGSLVSGEDGPEISETTFRWTVSGRTEYDGKGRLIRSYHPYFLNDWKYVSDDSARKELYADTYFYDALGRQRQVLTAKGWIRREWYSPWLLVSEDENDTITEN